MDGNTVQPFLTPGAWFPRGKRRKLAGQGKRHSIAQHPFVLAILWGKKKQRPDLQVNLWLGTHYWSHFLKMELIIKAKGGNISFGSSDYVLEVGTKSWAPNSFFFLFCFY